HPLVNEFDSHSTTLVQALSELPHVPCSRALTPVHVSGKSEQKEHDLFFLRELSQLPETSLFGLRRDNGPRMSHESEIVCDRDSHARFAIVERRNTQLRFSGAIVAHGRGITRN